MESVSRSAWTGSVDSVGRLGLRWGWPALRVLLLASLLLALPGDSRSQQNSNLGASAGGMGSRFPSSSRGMSQDSDLSPLDDPYNSTEAQKRMRMLNAERQKAMIADSDKLLKLATELNNEVAHSNSGELTAAQLRKVAEIEKLAHTVRDKMVMSLRGPQLNGIDNNSPAPFYPNPAQH
jgi:hypothetical protein